MTEPTPHIIIEDLTMAYGSTVIQQGLNFTIHHGDIFVIMGSSGCGKSTLVRNLIGLVQPTKGRVLYNGINFWESEQQEREQLLKKMGILYQSGALWSSLTLADNVALPLKEYSGLSDKHIQELVSFKLSLVGLTGFEEYYPSEISGGMKKRAGLARAMALDPEILFFDEPSAGLDPVSAHLLDELILQLRESLGTTIVVVTHDLASIYAIANDSVFLDTETKTMIAAGDPKYLLVHSENPKIIDFLTRGEGKKSTQGIHG